MAVADRSERVRLVPRYEKSTVKLPDWCPALDYLDHFQKVQWLVAVGWPDSVDARPFFKLADRQLAMLAWLFKEPTTRTSSFWVDLRFQVKEWAKSGFHPTPLSEKQWLALDGEHIDQILERAK